MITQEVFDDQTLTQPEFDNEIDQLTNLIPPEIEIDSVKDVFGEVYRVWNGRQLLGTFYQNPKGKWIAQSCNSDDRYCCDTHWQAQLTIITVNGLLLVDAA